MSPIEHNNDGAQATGGAATRVLIVDDEPRIAAICARVAAELGYTCRTATDGEEAAKLVDEEAFDVVLTDIRMPVSGGFDLFRHVQSTSPKTAVIMMTAYGTIDQAVEAMKGGLFDYISKPFDVERLGAALQRAVEWRRTALSGTRKWQSHHDGEAFHGILGRTSTMEDVFERVVRAAAVNSTVLIQGESGTGKELVARAVHACSPRSHCSFLPLDCSSLGEHLVGSELFGHEKGAFTGADRANEGVLRAAGGGTVFLDEVGELAVSVQAKFLRALQEKEVRPVGATAPVPFHARVIAATNRDLAADTATGAFRTDLFYRLHVIPIDIPPLRERREDIPLLAEAFLARHSTGKERAPVIGEDAMAVLLNHDWPGNVRELENCIEQLCVLGAGPVVTAEDLPLLRRPQGRPHQASAGPVEGIQPLAVHEARAVESALAATGWNKTQAAKALGISVPTLYAKIRKYDIRPDPPRQ